MTTWKMIEKHGGRRQHRRDMERTTPAVQRNFGAKASHLIIPVGMTAFKSANIYSDGNGRLAFHFCEGGAYRIASCGPVSKCLRVTIPSAHTSRIPAGTTDAVLTRDGDMHVLDTAQFSKHFITAAT